MPRMPYAVRPSRDSQLANGNAPAPSSPDLLLTKADCRQLLDQLGILSITDLDGQITYANEAFIEISGYEAGELIGKNHSHLNSGLHSRSFFRELYKTVARGEVWRKPIRNRRKNGTFYWVDTLVAGLRNPDGKLLGYSSLRLDITESVKAQARLAERNTLLRGVLDNFPGGIAVYDSSLQMIACNEGLKTLLDYPDALFATGYPTLAELYRHNAKRGEYGSGNVEEIVESRLRTARLRKPHRAERIRPNGSCIELRRAPLPQGGFVSVHLDVTERKRQQATIEDLAQHDFLTGIANRRLFTARLDAELCNVSQGAKVALLYMDLDRFKAVNDTLGHQVGDALLCQVADRLRKNTRRGDLVARLGGDEFAILQVNPKSAADLEALAKRLLAALCKPYHIDGHTLHVSASLGIAWAPADAIASEELNRCADLALFQSKALGRGCYSFFEPAMNEKVQRRRSVENSLRMALAHGELELHYQPIVDVTNRTTTSCEALLRWKQPKNSHISPFELVGVAEECGLIGELGDWVLRRACQEARNWPVHVSVSVNISAAQFKGQDLYASVLAALGDLEPHRLVLEITETTLMHDTEQVTQTLRNLRTLGVKFALDDFGTGYSSLSYLRVFPFDKIKIDKAFIAGISETERARGLLGAIANLGVVLGMSTVAEGIETEEQFAIAKDQGCSEVQGYLISKAVTAAKLGRFLERATRTPRHGTKS